MNSPIFMDTSYAIALFVPNDHFHAKAVELSQAISASKVELITTRAVLYEIGNSLAKPRARQSVAQFLSLLETSPHVSIMGESAAEYARALILFKQHADKEWSLTDCLSFVVMREMEITDALTADAHFQQAGFRALLSESPG